MLIGIRVPRAIGIGDAIQFTPVPENYFRHTGEKLVDLESSWVFDFNPYVLRNVDKVDKEYDLWKLQNWQIPDKYKDRDFMMCLAENGLRHFDVPMVMNRPRLYRYEEFDFWNRYAILLHVKGKSHGQMPEHVVRHVIEKYGEHKVFWVGLESDWKYSIKSPPFLKTSNLWDLAELISQCRMFIGVDSGPSWVAQCYPDVITKKVRLTPSAIDLQHWLPLEWCRLGSYWDDRSAYIYNPSENDAGFTWSYKRI